MCFLKKNKKGKLTEQMQFTSFSLPLDKFAFLFLLEKGEQ